MKRKATVFLSILVVLLVTVLTSAVFFVDQRAQVLVLQFGDPVKVVQDPGLNFKIPFVQNVVRFDKRILLFDNAAEEIIAADRKRLIVDSFVRYRITDPLRYFQSVRYEAALENRLGSVVNDSLRLVLGKVPLNELISIKRSSLMEEVTLAVAKEAIQFGIKVDDVRIKRADLPSENSQAIYRRMQTERQQEASLIRAEGEEKSRMIRAESEKDRTVLIAEAERDGEILRGEGEAEKNKILGAAFSKDIGFFSFYRAMQAYTQALAAGDTTMVLSPNSEFFEFFRDDKGQSIIESLQ